MTIVGKYQVASLDVVPDLQTQKLQYVTKERPRRAKNIRPTNRQPNFPGTSDENQKVHKGHGQIHWGCFLDPSTPPPEI